MVSKGSELFNCTKELNELDESSLEEIKLSKDLVGRELKLFSFWHIHQPFLGEIILLLISLVEVNAALKDWDKLIWWIFILFPKDIITLNSAFSVAELTGLHSLEVENVPAAPGDHFCCDLNKEASHPFVCVVVSGDGVNHLDTVHQGW